MGRDPKFHQRLFDVDGKVDTFAPTVRLESLRFVPSETVQRGFKLIEVDIGNAFVTSTLPKPVYMKMPKIIQQLPLFTEKHVGQKVLVKNGTVTLLEGSKKTSTRLTSVQSPTWQSPRGNLQGFVPKRSFKIVKVDATIGGSVELSNGSNQNSRTFLNTTERSARSSRPCTG